MEPLPPLSLDSLSVWIQNKQLLEQFTDDQLNTLQTDIITQVFGGFHCLIKQILRHTHVLKLSQHFKLHQLMSTNLDQDIFTNYRQTTKQQHNGLSIVDLPDDCLSHTMKFLTHNERYTVQQCCRLLAITTRHESSVNDIETELPLMRMVPYKRRMIEGFMSNEEDRIMDAFEIYLKYKKLIQRGDDIQCFGVELFDRFKQLLIDKKSHPTVKRIISGLEHDLVSFGLLPFAAQILTEIVNEVKPLQEVKADNEDNEEEDTRPAKQEVDGTAFRDMMYSLSCAVDWSNDLPLCDGLIAVVLDALPCYKLFKYEENWQKEDAFSCGCEIFYEILKYDYTQHRQVLVDNQFVDKLYAIAEVMDVDDFYSCDVFKVLQRYLKGATSQEIEELIQHKFMNKLFDKEQGYIKHGIQNCILSLIQCCNHSQRKKVIERVMQMGIDKYISRSFRKEILKVLEAVNDVDAKSKIEKIQCREAYAYGSDLSDIDSDESDYVALANHGV